MQVVVVEGCLPLGEESLVSGGLKGRKGLKKSLNLGIGFLVLMNGCLKSFPHVLIIENAELSVEGLRNVGEGLGI